MTDLIEIEINGKPHQVEPGSMIIEVADKAGISIPRFCYHKKLNVAANCRMCLVDVEKAPKPLPACATPVTAGMKVSTNSQKARDAQKAVMEFLLINHPLDCPICDQGGECELQDLSLGFGKDDSRYDEGKRAVKDDDLGPLIATEMTRCIQCTRCVRFGQEVAGVRELGATGRGENMQITTYIKHSLTSEVSGNIIDLCPVGALTSKPFRFKARAWELKQTPSIAPHDCLGSNIHVHTRRGEVMRVVPRECETINEVWISDRDRFSYLGLAHEDRLLHPMIKKDGSWEETDWDTALQFAAKGLQSVLNEYGSRQLGGLISPNSTLEEFYLFQKLIRGLGSNTIDHRLHQTDFSDQKQAPLYPSLGIKIADLEHQEQVFLIGSNIVREQPLLALRLNKAVLHGSKVFGLNAMDYSFTFEQAERAILSPTEWVKFLAAVLKILAERKSLEADWQDSIKNIAITREAEKLAKALQKGKSSLVLLGAVAQNHPESAAIRVLAQKIAQILGAKYGVLTEGSNAAGAWIAGAIPHRGSVGEMLPEAGLAAQTALTAGLRAYVLFGIEPEYDCANPFAVMTSLSKSDFVMACSSYRSQGLLETAHVIFPTACFTETSGTYVNIEGIHQGFNAIVKAPGQARAGTQILSDLAKELALVGFEYQSMEIIAEELRERVFSRRGDPVSDGEVKLLQPINLEADDSAGMIVTRITEWPLYSCDGVVRRAKALQDSAGNEKTGVYLSPELAEKLRVGAGSTVMVKQGLAKAILPVFVEARLSKDCVWIPAGRKETATLGASFGHVEIELV